MEQPICVVRFSPHGGCTETIVETLQEARQRVLVQTYSFTSQPIAGALVAAHHRGVRVEAILDKSQRTERHTAAETLIEDGIPVTIDDAHTIAHNKVIVIDGRTVITGSFNFTQAAEERNAENLLVIRDPEVAAEYERNWRAHRAHAKSYP